MIQGITIGIAGLLFGDILGVWLSKNIDTLVKTFEGIFKVNVLPCDVYYVCEFPSALDWNDVFSISVVSFLLCLLATVYPALRAARIQPVEALRHE